MSTVIQKWGNSLGVRIPSDLARKQRLTEGESVEVVETKRGVEIRVVKNDRDINLSSMVKRITSENLHEKEGWGGPRGHEVW